jgi:SET domain-containing protein
MYKPLPDGLIIAKSRIHSQGLFTTKFIEGNIDLGLTHIVVDDELIRTPLGGFINHSDEANCIKVKETVSADGDRYTLFTLRDIKAWEELTIKYTFYEVKK